MVNEKRTQRLYREEGLTVRKRRGRKRATGTRAPLLTVARPNARMRDELLNETLFFSLGHARSAMDRWVADYNHSRPHSALGYRTPAAYAAQLTAMRDRRRVIEALHRSPIAPPAQQRQSQPPTPVLPG